MKILQLGSGSMGSRRLRDLSRRPDVTLALYDERADRRQRAHERFGVTVFTRLEDALAWEPAALVISTPPGTRPATCSSPTSAACTISSRLTSGPTARPAWSARRPGEKS